MTSMPLSILIVDDDVDNALSLGELFELDGHQVNVVYSGHEAIEKYNTQNFDVAFMDVMMPGMNGIESFLEIRRMKPQAKIYMMTGYSVEELLLQAVKNGAMGVLEKPFEAGEVLRITNSVGPNGLVVTAPELANTAAADSIASAITASGRACKLVRTQGQLVSGLDANDVLVLDTNDALIDAVSVFQEVQATGHSAPTIIVPKHEQLKDTARSFSDVMITGVLNKPFDPSNLITKLPQLAA
jgi:two-component system, NtrC family, response regulator HydG